MATIDPTPEQLHAQITGQPLRTGIHSVFNACMYQEGCKATAAEVAKLRAALESVRVWFSPDTMIGKGMLKIVDEALGEA